MKETSWCVKKREKRRELNYSEATSIHKVSKLRGEIKGLVELNVVLSTGVEWTIGVFTDDHLSLYEVCK